MRKVLVALAMTLVVVAGAIWIVGGEGESGELPEISVDGRFFAHKPDSNPLRFFRVWGAERAGFPGNTSFEPSLDYVETYRLLASEEFDGVGFLPLPIMAAAMDDSDADLRLLPYTFVNPDYVFRIGVRNGSNISGVYELQDKTMGIGRHYSGGVMTLTALEIDAGLNRSDLEVYRREPVSVVRNLRAGRLDAGVVTVRNRPAVTSIFDPWPVFRQRFNGTPVLGAFVVSSPSLCSWGGEAVEAYIEGSEKAASSVEEITADYEDREGRNRSDIFHDIARSVRGKGTVKRITEGDIGATEAVINYSFRNGFMETRYAVRELFMENMCGFEE